MGPGFRRGDELGVLFERNRLRVRLARLPRWPSCPARNTRSFGADLLLQDLRHELLDEVALVGSRKPRTAVLLPLLFGDERVLAGNVGAREIAADRRVELLLNVGLD